MDRIEALKQQQLLRVADALAASDAVVGPACSNVEVQETIDMTEPFREAYVQGYRHALADVREVLRKVKAGNGNG